MTGTVPQHEAKDFSFARSQVLHGPVHPQLRLERSDRPWSLPGLLDESLAEPAPPHGRAAVVGDHPASHTEKPEPIFGRGRDHRKTAPGDEKYLRNDVLDLMRSMTRRRTYAATDWLWAL